jgi:hypothetical protein
MPPGFVRHLKMPALPIPCARQNPETGTPLSAGVKTPLSGIVPIACRAMHDLCVAVSFVLYSKSPRIECREISTREHR